MQVSSSFQDGEEGELLWDLAGYSNHVASHYLGESMGDWEWLKNVVLEGLLVAIWDCA